MKVTIKKFGLVALCAALLSFTGCSLEDLFNKINPVVPYTLTGEDGNATVVVTEDEDVFNRVHVEVTMNDGYTFGGFAVNNQFVEPDVGTPSTFTLDLTKNSKYAVLTVVDDEALAKMNFVSADGQSTVFKNVKLSLSKTEGNARIAINTPYLVIENVIVEGSDASKKVYNYFEQVKANGAWVPFKSVKVENLKSNGQNITHNILNLYAFEDNATVVVKNSSFDFANDANVMRLANNTKGKNVKFELSNLTITYPEMEDKTWNLVFFYQMWHEGSANVPNILADEEARNTMKFKLTNCKVNGNKVTTKEKAHLLYNSEVYLDESDGNYKFNNYSLLGSSFTFN